MTGEYTKRFYSGIRGSLSIPELAKILGINVQSMRNKINRNSLTYEEYRTIMNAAFEKWGERK